MDWYRMEAMSYREAHGQRPKDCFNSYRFYRNGEPIYTCHVSQWCMKPCHFNPTQADSLTGLKPFVLAGSRKWMPTTWLAYEQDPHQAFGAFKRKVFGKTQWEIMDAKGNAVGLIRARHDRQAALLRIVGFFLGGNQPDGYEFYRGGQLLARMEKEDSPNPVEPVRKRRFLRWIHRALKGKDWVIREHADLDIAIDERLYLAGAVLIQSISRDVQAAS